MGMAAVIYKKVAPDNFVWEEILGSESVSWAAITSRAEPFVERVRPLILNSFSNT